MSVQEKTSPFASKLPNLGTTIFTVMSRLAQEHQAINLSQGFPDFECPSGLIDKVSHYMRQGFNQYAPMAGIMPLREKIAQKTEELYGCTCNPETDITVVSGASEAIFNAIAAVIREGDEAIIFEPAYDLYRPTIELFGGRVIAVPLKNQDYRLDWEKTQAALSDKTRLIILNTPHNPTGSTWKAADMQALSQLIRDKDIYLIGDEVYEHIIFDEQQHESLLRYPDLADKSFVVSSFGKTFHATGWKIGYCVAPAHLSKEFRKIHQYNTFATFTPAQFALADFLEEKSHYLELNAFYQARRDYLQKLMQETPFELLPCEGTYFQLASYKNISAEKDTEYAIRLTKELGVATIPISVFYADGVDHQVLRFCFAKKYETMDQAIEKILKNPQVLEAPQ